MDIFQGVLDLVFPVISFENEIYTFIVYVLNVSVRCGLLSYVLMMVYNILKLAVSAPKTKLL